MLLFKRGNNRDRKFNKLRKEYKLQTQGYFEPQKFNFVSRDNLIKIFEEKVVNPNRIQNPEVCSAYSYLVVCNIGIDELNEDKEYRFETGYDDLFMKSQWFAYFSTDLENAIAIPNKGQILFKPQTYVRNIQEESHFYGGSDFQFDKIVQERVLTTAVSLENMIVLLKESFFENIDKELSDF